MQAITRLSIFTSFALLLTATISSSATACDGYRRSYSHSYYAPVQSYSYGYGYGYGARTFAPRSVAPATRITPSPAVAPSIPGPSAAPITPGPAVTPGPAQVNITPAPNPNQTNPNQTNPNQINPNQATLRAPLAPVASNGAAANPNQSNLQF